LIKLCVGAENISDVVAWQQHRSALWRDGKTGVITHVTRNRPKRADELIASGSLYWVIKGKILVRNRILDLEERQDEWGRRCCGIVLKAEPVKTEPRSHRPFQGWRYFDPARAPEDISEIIAPGELPTVMRADLKELGLI